MGVRLIPGAAGRGRGATARWGAFTVSFPVVACVVFNGLACTPFKTKRGTTINGF
jgi:hypothetical protein